MQSGVIMVDLEAAEALKSSHSVKATNIGGIRVRLWDPRRFQSLLAES